MTKTYYSFKKPLSFIDDFNTKNLEEISFLLKNWSFLISDQYNNLIKPFKLQNGKSGRILILQTHDYGIYKSFNLIKKEILLNLKDIYITISNVKIILIEE